MSRRPTPSAREVNGGSQLGREPGATYANRSVSSASAPAMMNRTPTAGRLDVLLVAIPERYRYERCERYAATLSRARGMLETVAVIDDVLTLGTELERSYPVYVHGRLKFRVGSMVYTSFSHDQLVMGFGFPKDERAARVRRDAPVRPRVRFRAGAISRYAGITPHP
jgi:hypothetical protein